MAYIIPRLLIYNVKRFKLKAYALFALSMHLNRGEIIQHLNKLSVRLLGVSLYSCNYMYTF